MEKEQIDVLAVMDEVVRHLDKTMPTPLNRRGGSHLSCEHHSGLRFDANKTRAAVAELIEAADHYMEVRGSTHGQPARERLRAALARVAANDQVQP